MMASGEERERLARIEENVISIKDTVIDLKNTFDEAESDRKEDHDAVIVLTERVENVCEKAENIEARHQERQKSSLNKLWSGFFVILAASVGALFHWISIQLKGQP